jgi:hypothetical protein
MIVAENFADIVWRCIPVVSDLFQDCRKFHPEYLHLYAPFCDRQRRGRCFMSELAGL